MQTAAKQQRKPSMVLRVNGEGFKLVESDPKAAIVKLFAKAR